MLLTKLIPPQSIDLQRAVMTFNNFLELPNADPKERLVLTFAGGRGCCKSTIASGMVMKGCAETGLSAVCLRKHGEDVMNSVSQQIQWTLDALGQSGNYTLRLSGYSCHFTSSAKSSHQIYCVGIDQGLHLGCVQADLNRFPRIRFVWIDEADQLSGMEELESALSVLPLADNPIVILSFNPPADPLHWSNQEPWGVHAVVNGVNQLRYFFHPCYLDVPVEWLGEKFFRDAETMKRLNEDAYRNAYLGWPNGSPSH